MNDGGVILASEAGADALQANGGAFAHQVHGDLASLRNFLGATARFGQLGFGNFVVLRNGMQHGVEAYATAERRGNFRYDLLRNAHVDIVVHQA